jgi:signal peptidase II
LKYLRLYFPLILIAVIVIALDQWTKILVRTNIPLGSVWLPEWLQWLSPYARFIHIYNTGAAFGMFKDLTLVFTILPFIVVGVILYYYQQLANEDWVLRLALGMQMGGALGNLVDRLTQSGRVTDFISVGSFAVFNVADAAITVGVGILLLDVWIKERQLEAQKKATAASDSAELPLPPGEGQGNG